MRRKGFSLTELLVVLAILALLASIAIPTSGRMMALGRQTICADHLSQLMRLIISAQQLGRTSGMLPQTETPFMEKHFWPERPAASLPDRLQQVQRLFGCPEAFEPLWGEAPPLMYKSGMNHQFMPFDPDSFHCCSRKGVNSDGEPYTEYCIEENPHVESKWSHADCCGEPSWSTNDGIWRVYDRPVEGMRVVILTYYNCGWPNELWINGKFYAGNLASQVGMTIKFREVYTNYGYNALLGTDHIVSPDTIVLMDSNRLHVDPEDVDIIANLNHFDTARHLGKVNVLNADGAVRTVSPTDLYPDINPGSWTPALD